MVTRSMGMAGVLLCTRAACFRVQVCQSEREDERGQLLSDRGERGR